MKWHWARLRRRPGGRAGLGARAEAGRRSRGTLPPQGSPLWGWAWPSHTCVDARVCCAHRDGGPHSALWPDTYRQATGARCPRQSRRVTLLGHWATVNTRTPAVVSLLPLSVLVGEGMQVEGWEGQPGTHFSQRILVSSKGPAGWEARGRPSSGAALGCPRSGKAANPDQHKSKGLSPGKSL